MEKEGGITRRDVEAKLAGIGDYVKMDYLSRCLKGNLDFDTKKFVLTRLSQVYEGRGLYAEAGKMMRNSADINTTFDAKLNDFMKSVDLFVKAGNFDEAESSFAKAMGCATELQKVTLKSRRKEMYKVQAKEYIKRDKRKHAMEVYEKLLALELSPLEKQEAQLALLGLYEKLGKVKEFYTLKKSI